MAFDWSSIFDNYGIKQVTATDKVKKAYVPNEDQRNALASAGKDPKARSTFPIEIIFDASDLVLNSSYYNSVRKGSGRDPEARIGRELIGWCQVGDRIVLGNKGSRVLAAKIRTTPVIASEAGRVLARNGDQKKILARARKATGKPARRTRQVSDFVRNLYVVAAALIRAAGLCEMPGCARRLFKRQDGTNFLEVHHVTPLAEGGDDTLVNAAALCPSCHRELHYGVRRAKKRAALAAEITKKAVP